jgi:hypothetical protein
VARIRNHPLVNKSIPVHGYIYDVKSGRLVEVPQASAIGGVAAATPRKSAKPAKAASTKARKSAKASKSASSKGQRSAKASATTKGRRSGKGKAA